jgi:methionyl-tRNA formyltransferase
MSQLKIVFAGTPEIAATVLRALVEHGFNLELVLTQPDRPAGRGLRLRPSPVKEQALAYGIPILQPSSLRNNHDLWHQLKQLSPDFLVVVAYGLILPQDVLNIPLYGCINIHVSLLPRWRGAAPIQRSILAGDCYSGITIMQMDAGLDSGAILLQEKVLLAENETAGSLHDKLAAVGAAKIVEFLSDQAAYPPVAQDVTGLSYAAKISKEEAVINWEESALIIERKIRAYNPVPGAYTYLQGQLLKIWQAKAIPSHEYALPGTIINVAPDSMVIACGGQSAISINEIQLAGGKRKTIEQFLAAKNQWCGLHCG